jgi:imidazolonepropionase-like amidohydrolase
MFKLQIFLLRKLVVLGFFACFFPGTARTEQSAHPFSDNSFAIRDVRIFDGEHSIENASVIIRNGKIDSIGGKVSPGLTIIDGKGKTLLPGLIDSHVHVFRGAQEDALRFGITTEMDMYCPQADFPKWKRQRESYARTNSADTWSAGFGVTAPGGVPTEMMPGMNLPTLAKDDDAKAFVDKRVAEGSDYIKLFLDDGSAYGRDKHFNTLTPAQLKAVIDAAHQDIKMAIIHIAKEEDARLAIEDGVDGLAHMFQDKPADEAFVRLAKDRHVFIIGTLAVLAGASGSDEAISLANDPQIKPYLSSFQRETLTAKFPHPDPKVLSNALESLKALHAAAVPVLAGDDAPNPGTAHGPGLYEELDLLVQGGLTPSEALHAATALPAAIFKLKDRGLIAPGLRADLVLINGNPTAQITAIRHVDRIWKNGYPVDRKLPLENSNP